MRINRFMVAAASALALLAGAGRLDAQSATQVVRFKVVATNRIAVASSATMRMQRPGTGRAPTSASVAAGSYGISTNEANQKISASIDAPMPAGMELSVAMGAPAGAASKGAKALGTSSRDVVTGITAVSASGLPITYSLRGASDKAGPRVVTYTITSGL